MALSDAMRLYDISTRLQLYVEGVKVYQAKQFNNVLMDVNDALRRTLGRVQYRTLDGLTKAQLNRLILDLRDSQSKIYSKYTEDVIKQLKQFMRADLEVNRRAWVSAYKEQDDEEQDDVSDDDASHFIAEENDSDSHPLFGIAFATDDDKAWSQITNQPIPANGLFLLPFLKTFTTSAQASVENIIRKAWANRQTVDETLTELVGDGSNKQGTSSVLQRISVQGTAVVHTAMAHVASIVTAGVISTLFGKYCWYSVMDNGTTDICRSRNLKVYRFGQGPIPPAHVRCRSHIGPVGAAGAGIRESLYTWFKRQPNEVQDDVLGDKAESLRDGTMTADDLSKYGAKPLTLEQFRKKIKQILSR